MKKVLFIVLTATLILLVAGCNKPSEEKAMVDVARQYTEGLASKNFELVRPLTTGDALDQLNRMIPLLENLKAETKIENFYGEVDYLNRHKTRGCVVAHYTQVQTIEGYGTSKAELTVVFDMVKLGNKSDAWKIYAVKTMNKGFQEYK